MRRIWKAPIPNAAVDELAERNLPGKQQPLGEVFAQTVGRFRSASNSSALSREVPPDA